MIEKLGDSYVRMSVNYESEGISEDIQEKLGEKLDEMDRDKKGYKERPGRVGEPDWYDKNLLETI